MSASGPFSNKAALSTVTRLSWECLGNAPVCQNVIGASSKAAHETQGFKGKSKRPSAPSAEYDPLLWTTMLMHFPALREEQTPANPVHMLQTNGLVLN